MHNRPKMAIIGVGRWGKKLLAELDRHTEIIAASHKSSADTTEWLARHHPKIKIVTPEEIFAKKEIEAVVVAAPIASHFALTKQAILAGKDIWVEKPVGANVEETRELVNLARASSKILMAGYIFLYHQAWRTIQNELISRDEVPVYLHTSWNKWGTFDSSLEDSLLCHDTALALSLFGKGISLERLENTGLVSAGDIAYYRINRGDKVVGSVALNRVCPKKKKTVLVKGNRGSIWVWENERLFKNQDRVLKEIPLGVSSALANECLAFINAVETKEGPETDGEFAAAVQKIIGELRG